MSTQHPEEPEQVDAVEAEQAPDVAPATEQVPPTAGPQHELTASPLPPAYATGQPQQPLPAQTGTSNRGLWIGLGIGAAVVAALVLVGGVAFGVVLRHHERNDEGFRSPMMSQQQGPGGEVGPGPGAPPGGGYGSNQDGTGPGGMMDGQGNPMPGGPFGDGLGPLSGGLHATMVVPDGSGYSTVAMQRGTVSSVSATSLTVRSTDGYSATYRVSSATQVIDRTAQSPTGAVTDLSQGDDVSVIAKGAQAPLTAQVVARG